MKPVNIILLLDLFFSMFLYCYFDRPMSALASPSTHATKPAADKQDKAQPAKPHVSEESENGRIPHLTDWKQISYMADKLIDEGKLEEAHGLLVGILPRAKKEAPTSLDYGLTLCRLASELYATKNYPQANERIDEALAVVSHNPPAQRQRSIMWRCMISKAAIVLALKKNAEAEALSRKAIAYSIAFPDIAKPSQVKIAYQFLNQSLEAQNRLDEAKKVTTIMNMQ